MRRIAILLLLATGLWIIGCGSNNTMSKNPNPGQPGQPPTQPPPPTPGTTQFSETMLSNDSTGTVDGMVTIDTSGNGTVKLTGGGSANTAYAVSFCPFATGSCNKVGTLNADGSGTGSATFTMGHGTSAATLSSPTAPTSPSSARSTSRRTAARCRRRCCAPAACREAFPT